MRSNTLPSALVEHPLYLCDRLVGWYPEATLRAIAGVEIVYNRRGHIKRARLKRLDSTVRLTPDGFAFEQHLQSGFVWALSGVRGSN